MFKMKNHETTCDMLGVYRLCWLVRHAGGRFVTGGNSILAATNICVFPNSHNSTNRAYDCKIMLMSRHWHACPYFSLMKMSAQFSIYRNCV